MIILRYILKEILSTLLVTVVILLLILMTNQFVHYLNSAAAGGISVMAVVQLMLLQIPLFLAYILPLALFLAVLLTLGQMYVHQEITVLSACGFSQAQLIKSILWVAVPLLLLTAWLTFSVQPTIEWYRIQLSRNAMQAFSVDKLFPKRFQNVLQSGWVLYAEGSAEEGGLKNVFLAKQYPASSNYPLGFWEIVKTDRLYQKEDSATQLEFGHLEKGVSYRGQPGMKNYRIIHFDHAAMALDSATIVTNDKMLASFFSMRELWENYHQNLMNQVEFNWRLSIPVSVLILALLAVPLSYLRPRQGRYAKLFYALLIYLFYTNMLFLSRSWAFSEKVGPVLGLWWIHVLMLLVALSLIAYRQGSFSRLRWGLLCKS